MELKSPLARFGVPEEVAESIWPAPSVSGDTISHTNATGIQDPRDRNAFEAAIVQINKSDRTNTPRDPELLALVARTLGKFGVDVSEFELTA